MSASRLSRYLPLIALAVVQIMLVLGTSKPPTVIIQSGQSLSGPSGSSGNGVSAPRPAGPSGSSGGGGGVVAGASGRDRSGASGVAVPPPNSNQTGSAVVTNGPRDLSHCDQNGKQLGPTVFMPPCQPVWHGGNNGGTTMTGVTATKINYVYYAPQANPEVNAILARKNLAATPQDYCNAISAWQDELNKRWEFYGRKLHSLDGPKSSNNDGSSQSGSCTFPYFQSQCTGSPPDAKCYRADADVIARMKPAIVIDPVGVTYVDYRLAQDHIMVMTGALVPEQYYEALAPYMYGFTNGTQQAELFAEFWCKKLVGKPVQFAGTAPGDVKDATKPAPIRKLGISYIKNPGDDTAEIDAKYMAKLVTGSWCGKPGDVILTNYASDISRSADQTNAFIAAMKSNHVTDSTCVCDPIAPAIASNAEDQQNYHPEQVMTGAGLLDYDVLAQLYNQNVWRNTFGLSNLGASVPFSDSEAVKAWHDVGRSGEPDQTENLSLVFYQFMGMMFQQAGPIANTRTIHNGLLALKPMHFYQDGPQPSFGFSTKYPWSGFQDVREVYWCPTRTSPVNGEAGSYVPLMAGKRLQQGQMTSGLDGAFPNGQCPVAGTQQQ